MFEVSKFNKVIRLIEACNVIISYILNVVEYFSNLLIIKVEILNCAGQEM